MKQISDKTMLILYEGLAKSTIEHNKYKAKGKLSQEDLVKLSSAVSIEQTLEYILHLINKDNLNAV